jgi:hypothetical protein
VKWIVARRCQLSQECESRQNGSTRAFDLISDALPFGRLWYAEPNAISNAVGYAKFYSRSHDAVIHVYDDAGNVIDTLAVREFKHCDY